MSVETVGAAAVSPRRMAWARRRRSFAHFGAQFRADRAGMIGVFVLEPDAPLLVHEAAMLIAMVPVLRLIPPGARRYLGAWPYAASALFLMMRLGFLISASLLLYRFYLIALCLLGIAAMLWLLRRSSGAGDAQASERWRWSAQAGCSASRKTAR